MAASHSLSKPKAQGSAPSHRARASGAAGPTTLTSPVTGSVSAFYTAGPALTLGAPVQAKLAIGRANDPYEREADAVATQLEAGQPVHSISAIPPGGLNDVVQRQAEEQEEEPEEQPLAQPLLVQRQAIGEEEEGESEEERRESLVTQRQTDEEAPGEEPEEEEQLQPLLVQRQAVAGREEEEAEEEQPEPPLAQRQAVEEESAPEERLEEEAQETEPLPEEVRLSRAVVQTNPATANSADASGTEPVSQAIRQRGAGEPLNPRIQSTLESHTGLDMGDVRIHRDNTASQAAQSLRARAFTHGSDIWLGPGESPDDLRLIAHESTHVVQQTSGAAPDQTIQRKPSDYQHPEDGGVISGRLNRRFAREIRGAEQGAATTRGEVGGESSGTQVEPGGADRGRRGEERATARAEARRSTSTINRDELRDRSDELKSETRPDVDRPAQEQPRVTQSANAVEREAESPPESVVENKPEAKPAEEEGAGEAAKGAAEQAAGLAAQAFAAGAAEPEPAPEVEVQPPEPVTPVDSAGEALPSDPDAEMTLADLAERAQFLREQGTLMRSQAAEGRGNAQIVRGNLAKVGGEISKAEEGIAKSQEHASYRREAVGQAEQAADVSEEKAATVAAQAPNYQSKADEGKEETGPMSSEAGGLASRNAANTPDDPEAAAKSREQGQKINQVGSDTTTMDSAVSQTRTRADSLAQDAAQATQMNTDTRGKIGASQQQLDQLDERLTQHSAESGQARGHVESMAGQPDDLRARANQLDEQGIKLKASSFELEERLQRAQRNYAEYTVPELKPWEGEEPSTEEGPIQLFENEESEATAPEVPAPEVPVEAPALAAAGATPAGAAAEPTSTAPPPTATPTTETAAVRDSASATGFQPGAAEEEHAAASEEEPTTDSPARGEGAEVPAEEGEAPAEETTPAEPETAGGAVESLPEVTDLPPRERGPIDLNCEMPPWVTGVDPESCRQRETAAQRQEEERRREISEINQLAEGRPISQLGAGERVGIALRMVGRRYHNMISNIKWPGWGNLAKALLDPRSMLTGTIQGLNMILKAGGGLFSAERWRQDPLGNLLKSAADIATGLAIVLGSITVLAGVVAAIMGALMLITFGAAAPIALPVISVCTTIITTVGGWTIAVGKIALVLQALSLIKNLIDAATAQTAQDLQRETGEIQSDINGGFAAAMSIVGAKGAQAGLRRLRSRTAGVIRASRRAGGARALARQTVRAAPGRIATGARALPGRIAAGARAIPGRLAAGGRRLVTGARALPGRVVGGARRAVTAAAVLPGRIAHGARRRFAALRARVRGRRPSRELKGQVNLRDASRDSPAARDSNVRESAHLESEQLSNRQIRNEIDHIRDHPEILEGTLPNRRARIGRHDWQEQPGGRWCRHSNGPVCVLVVGESRTLEYSRKLAEENPNLRVLATRLETDVPEGGLSNLVTRGGVDARQLERYIFDARFSRIDAIVFNAPRALTGWHATTKKLVDDVLTSSRNILRPGRSVYISSSRNMPAGPRLRELLNNPPEGYLVNRVNYFDLPELAAIYTPFRNEGIALPRNIIGRMDWYIFTRTGG